MMNIKCSNYGVVFLSLIMFSLPLSIVAVEIFGLLFFVYLIYCKDWRKVKMTGLNTITISIILINLISLYFVYPLGTSMEIVKESLYLLVIPFVGALTWELKNYLVMLRWFIYGQSVNAIFGVIEALGVHIIDTYGQGHLGLVNFHIWSSMMLALAILFTLYDFIDKNIFSSLPVRIGILILLLWQMFTTTGRTGQATLALTIPILLFWIKPFYRKAILFILPAFLVLIFTLSRTVRNIWVSAYHQLILFHEGLNSITSVGLRLLYAKATLYMIQKHPLFGIGVGQFRQQFYALVDSGRLPYVPKTIEGVIGPTSSYLLYLSEMGIFGFLVLIAFIFAIYMKARRSQCTS